MEAQMGNLATGVAAPKKDVKKQALARCAGLVGKKIPDGPRNLKALTQRHLEVISLHLSGEFMGSEIARIIGCSTGTVYQILQDPLVQNVVEQFRAGQLADLEALLPKAISAIRDGMDAKDPKTRLLAVDRFMKMSKHNFDDQMPQHNMSVTIVDARTRFVEKIRGMVDVTPLAETEDGRTPSTASKALVAPTYSDTPAG